MQLTEGWQPDPRRIFQQRWWTGGEWTDRVRRHGTETVSPLNQPEPEARAAAAQLTFSTDGQTGPPEGQRPGEQPTTPPPSDPQQWWSRYRTVLVASALAATVALALLPVGADNVETADPGPAATPNLTEPPPVGTERDAACDTVITAMMPVARTNLDTSTDPSIENIERLAYLMINAHPFLDLHGFDQQAARIKQLVAEVDELPLGNDAQGLLDRMSWGMDTFRLVKEIGDICNEGKPDLDQQRRVLQDTPGS